MFFFAATAPTEIYTLPHHAALPSLILLALLTFAGASGWCLGQELPGEQVVEATLQEETQPASVRLTDQPEEEPVPELPPTIVPGRLGSFPAEPLEADTLLPPNRNPTPANKSGSSITVIDQDQIRTHGQKPLAACLRAQTGAPFSTNASHVRVHPVYFERRPSAKHN